MTMRLDPEGIETETIHRLVDFNDKDILEIGCGDGRLTARYADRDASVLAVDPDADEIAKANEMSLKQGMDQVIFQVGDITTLELNPSAYDLAVFSWSM